jgi:hypothetical protein
LRIPTALIRREFSSVFHPHYPFLEASITPRGAIETSEPMLVQALATKPDAQNSYVSILIPFAWVDFL